MAQSIATFFNYDVNIYKIWSVYVLLHAENDAYILHKHDCAKTFSVVSVTSVYAELNYMFID